MSFISYDVKLLILNRFMFNPKMFLFYNDAANFDVTKMTSVLMLYYDIVT